MSILAYSKRAIACLSRGIQVFNADRRAAVKFDLFGIILMAIAIAFGNIVGGMLGGMIGLGGGIIGALVIGFVIYALYTVITGGRISLMAGVIFAVCVYIANLITGIVGGMTGLGGGIIGLFLSAIFLSIVWGFIGTKFAPRGKAKTKTPIKL